MVPALRGSGHAMCIEDRDALRQELVATKSSNSKSSLAKTLSTLHAAGVLADSELGSGNERKQLERAARVHASAETPYGTVVQRMDLGIEGVPPWEYIHPTAFIYYLSTVCSTFSAMMSSMIAASNGSLKLILYGDEMTPGNVLRSDKGRQLLNIYYAFVEMPTWLLHRKDGWLLLGSIQTKVLKHLVGGSSALMKRVLLRMFVDGTANLNTGFMVACDGGFKVCRATFHALIADEKGLKEFFDIKGSGGWKCCISCKNVLNFIHKRQDKRQDRNDGYAVGIECRDSSKIDRQTNDGFLRIVDMLKSRHHTHSASSMDQLETDVGVNYNAHGLLFCDELRPFLKPVDQYCRDWQHTLVSGGVAELQLAAILTLMHKSKPPIHMDLVSTYAQKYTLPKSRGKVHPNWFNAAFVSCDHVKHFSSDVLAMYPLMNAFLIDIVLPQKRFIDHIECFGLMTRILGVLSLSCDTSIAIYNELKSLIAEHHLMFEQLYPELVKVKYHHMGHLPDDLLHIGKLISCFCTERKHKDVKMMVLHVFRNVEHTTTVDFVNYFVQGCIKGRIRFDSRCMINPREYKAVDNDSNLMVAWEMHTHRGEVHRGDVVWAISNGEHFVGRVVAFFAKPIEAECVVQMACYTCADDESNAHWDVSDPIDSFLLVDSIVAVVSWMQRRRNIIRIIVPDVAISFL